MLLRSCVRLNEYKKLPKPQVGIFKPFLRFIINGHFNLVVKSNWMFKNKIIDTFTPLILSTYVT